MKNKIALYGNYKKLNQIEDVLSKYLNEDDIPYEIHRISDSEQFLREYNKRPIDIIIMSTGLC